MQSPSYHDILSDLHETVRKLSGGTRLPGVRELAARYNVTIGTASRAIQELQTAGLVEVRPGIGAFVRDFRPIVRSSPTRLSRSKWGAGYQIQDADTAGRTRVVDVRTGEEPAPDWAAEPLGVQPGDQVAYRSRRFVVDGRPVQLATSYLPVEIARGTAIMHTDTGPGGSYARLAELGHAPVRFTEFVRARTPSPGEVEALSLLGGTSVIEITRHAVTEAGRCVEVNRMVLDGMAYLLAYEFNAG